MKRTHLESLVTEKALHLVNGSDNGWLVEKLSEENPDQDFPIKNVCAKVSVQLSNEIDSIVGFLGISKRIFLEAAFIDAVSKAKEIIDTEGVFEALHDSSVQRDEWEAKDRAAGELTPGALAHAKREMEAK